MTRFQAFLSLAITVWAAPLAALDLGPQVEIAPTAEVIDPPAPFGVAIGPASLGVPPPLLSLNGPRSRRSWKISLQNTSVLAVLEAIQDQLRAQGHSVIYACAAQDCGGFDFRNNRPILPLPAMYVDLGNFQYVSAEGINSLAEIMISQNAEHLFLQVTTIGAGAQQSAPAPSAQPGDTAAQNPVSKRSPADGVSVSPDQSQFQSELETTGKWVLDALSFTTGTTSVAAEGSNALQKVARYLRDNPNRRIALVGHSDWVGDFAGNQRLSQDRAAAVAQLLYDAHDIPTSQIETHGIGYLSPRASNGSDQGRQSNRRVEVVLLPDATP